MPLDLGSLTSGLEGVAASVDDDPPPTVAECAEAWTAAVEDYTTAIVPASTTVAAAAATLETALAAAFQSTDAAPAMELAFTAFASTLGGGMAGFVPTPPPAPVGFAGQFATHPASHSAAASAVAALIDTWMRTGTATPSGGGPPVSWS